MTYNRNRDQPDRQHADEFEFENTPIHAHDGFEKRSCATCSCGGYGGAAKIFRSVPDCGVTMAGNAENTPFVRVRALATRTMSEACCYVIPQAQWILNIAVAPVFFISYDAVGSANVLFIARYRKITRMIE